MKFSTYVSRQLKARKGTSKEVKKTAFLKEFARKCGVSLLTLQNAERGGRMVRYDKAKAISDATGGSVSIPELCE